MVNGVILVKCLNCGKEAIQENTERGTIFYHQFEGSPIYRKTTEACFISSQVLEEMAQDVCVEAVG